MGAVAEQVCRCDSVDRFRAELRNKGSAINEEIVKALPVARCCFYDSSTIENCRVRRCEGVGLM